MATIDGEIEEANERIVIEYANLSGRESANRAEFRERSRMILKALISKAVNKAEKKSYKKGHKDTIKLLQKAGLKFEVKDIFRD